MTMTIGKLLPIVKARQPNEKYKKDRHTVRYCLRKDVVKDEKT